MLLHQKTPTKFFIIEISQKCNYSCLYCYNKRLKQVMQMDLNDFKKIVDKILIFCKPSIIHIIGGEPFLHPHLSEMVSYLKEKKINISISTNGSITNREQLGELVDNSLVNYEVSLDTYSESIYKNICATNKKPSDVYHFVRTVKEYGCKVRTATILTRNNLQTLEKLIDICYSLLVDEIAFYQYISPNGIFDKLTLSKAEIESLLYTLNIQAAKYEIPFLLPIPIETCVMDTKEYSNLKFGSCSCANEKWFVDAGGNLKACELSSKSFGSLLEQDMKQIISTPDVQLFNEDHKLLACPSCANFKICNGGCRFTKIL